MDQPTENNDGNLPGHNDAQFPDYDYAQFPYDNTAQLPDHNHVQIPSHNDALALEPTLAQHNFGDGDLSAAPGVGQTTTPAEDQFDFGHEGMDLPQEDWDFTYGGGSFLNHDQAPQQPFGDHMTNWGTPTVAPQTFPGNSGHQATGSQQTSNLPGGLYTYHGSHSQGPFPPNFTMDYLAPRPPVRDDHTYHQQAYLGHQPAHTSPHIPGFYGTPASIVSDQQYGPASIETAQNPDPRKRKRHDEQEESGEEENEDKEANKKSKAAKGVETKARKEQDRKDRRLLIGLRDEVASRAFELASEHIPAGAERTAFEEQWDLLKVLNKEIDDNAEEYITWNGTRPNLRKSDRAVPERKQKED